MEFAVLRRSSVSFGRRTVLGLLIAVSSASVCSHAQTAGTETQPAKPDAPPVSEAATASVTVGGGTIDIRYNTPHMRGRKVMGGLVPYDQVWRTGANPATTLLVPAGTHTLYTLPGVDGWKLIVNNETGQWGTEYKPEMDLGRVAMSGKTMPAAQEVMSIGFENSTADSTELHVRWDMTDQYVTITKP
jgi:hypothetical protein